jgi:hypothetical protein
MTTWIEDTAHVVALSPTGVQGEWRTYCPGCEPTNGEAVERCRLYPEQWPESDILVEMPRFLL